MDDEILYSRNPISGVLEAYTSEGQFLGIIETMGDMLNDVPKEQKEADPVNKLIEETM